MFNIPSFFGFRAGGSFVPPLLDLFPGAAAAYSLRLLDSTYTGSAIQVRESTNNTTLNIGFVGGQLDINALLAHCAGANGFVTDWYDQSGNARNATQGIALNQPQIVSSGSVILENGNPSLNFVLGNTLQNLTYVQAQPFTAFYVGISDISEGSVFDGNSPRAFMRDGSIQAVRIFASSFIGSVVNSLFKTVYGLFNGASSDVKVNNTTTLSGNIGTNSIGGLLIGDGVFRPFDGRISELIIYASNQSSNQGGISDNINDFYFIY